MTARHRNTQACVKAWSLLGQAHKLKMVPKQFLSTSWKGTEIQNFFYDKECPSLKTVCLCAWTWSQKFPQNCSAKRELLSSRVLTKSLEFTKKKLDRWDPWQNDWEQMGEAHSPEILSINAYNECLSRLLHEKGLSFKKRSREIECRFSICSWGYNFRVARSWTLY